MYYIKYNIEVYVLAKSIPCRCRCMVIKLLLGIGIGIVMCNVLCAMAVLCAMPSLSTINYYNYTYTQVKEI